MVQDRSESGECPPVLLIRLDRRLFSWCGHEQINFHYLQQTFFIIL